MEKRHTGEFNFIDKYFCCALYIAILEAVVPIEIQDLKQRFNGRLISRNGDVTWPSSSHDLTSCDFLRSGECGL